MSRKLSLSIPTDEEDGGEDELFSSVGRGRKDRRGALLAAPADGAQAVKTAAEGNGNGTHAYEKLLDTDRRVFDYLMRLCREEGGDTCVTSFPKIHGACAVSLRQAQISTDRLCAAGLVAREGYDFGNLDKSKRGTVFRLLYMPGGSRNGSKGKARSRRNGSR